MTTKRGPGSRVFRGRTKAPEPVVVVHEDTNHDGFVVVTVTSGASKLRYRVAVEPLDVPA